MYKNKNIPEIILVACIHCVFLLSSLCMMHFCREKSFDVSNKIYSKLGTLHYMDNLHSTYGQTPENDDMNKCVADKISYDH